MPAPPQSGCLGLLGLPALPAPSGATWLLWNPLTLPSAAPIARLTRSAPALPLLPCLGVLALGVCCLAVRGCSSPASGARVVALGRPFPFPFLGGLGLRWNRNHRFLWRGRCFPRVVGDFLFSPLYKSVVVLPGSLLVLVQEFYWETPGSRSSLTFLPT